MTVPGGRSPGPDLPGAPVGWSAAMISPTQELAAPLLRREVTLEGGHGEGGSADLHVSSQGIFEAYVDGVPAGPDVLTPGWSSYEWRLRYRTYDVAPLLHETSVLGFSLGNGWYRGRLSWNGHREFYGDRLPAAGAAGVGRCGRPC